MLVNDHDFRSDAKGIALPYGIYDLASQPRLLFLGTTHDTPAFAVDNLAVVGLPRPPPLPRRHRAARPRRRRRQQRGRTRAWKHALQQRLCDRHGLTVTVCHYPTGASKWNPIEHRLFSEISKNWAGQPLDSYETILNYARTTRTATGLQVNAYLVAPTTPPASRSATRTWSELHLRPHDTQPTRNYTLSPR